MDKFFVKLTSEYSRIFANRNDEFFLFVCFAKKLCCLSRMQFGSDVSKSVKVKGY